MDGLAAELCLCHSVVAITTREYNREHGWWWDGFRHFNTVLYTKDGMEGHQQALYAFTTGIRGIAGPFFGAWMLIVCRRTGMPKEYLFLLSMVLIAAGSMVVFVHMRRHAEGSR